MAPRGVSNWRRPYTSIYNDNYRYGTNLYSDTLTDIEKRYSESISKTQLRSDRPDLTFTAFSGSNLQSSPAPVADSSVRETYTFSRQLSASPTREFTRSPNFESRLNATLKSAAYELDEDVEDVITKRIEARKLALARSQSEIHSKTETEEEDDFAARLERRKQALAKLQESRADSEEFTLKSKKTVSTTEKEVPLKPTSLYDDYSLWTLPKSTEKSSGLSLDVSKSKKKAVSRQTTTNGPSSTQWRDKSRNLQDQVESLDKSMSDTSTRLRTDLSSLRSKYHTEISDLSGSVENTTQQATDLQRLCKRQAGQLQELQSAYSGVERNVQEALSEMGVWQTKCKTLKKEMDRLREEVEQAINKRSKA